MLEVRSLDVFYGDARALSGVDLDVAAGEIVCIVGPNGAGKSTLVNTLAGLHRSASGRIAMDGQDITRLAGHQVCRHGLAIVPEGRRIFPAMSVRDNLDLGAYRREARAAHADSLNWVHELFPVLSQRAGQRAGSLSGGEQQMLAIGRALMARPRLLLLDEPSLGLAPVIVDQVFEVIATINGRGVSILLVEQNVQRALDVAQRAYLLSEGRILLQGTPAELVANDAVRRSVLGIA
ncbi:MAG TPA: ABC transporter ATP-binding protein [Candidatus Limnocylindria bacterium]|jgi:branched-chain amino acid transport system ATP-binding protein|nr:ABC transporter ATP-binding protein [Candidatus Limnocylindria bacterium]